MNYCVHILVCHNKVLLLKRSKKNNFFPSIWTPIIGKVKDDEDPKNAVLRETIEETSLKIKDDISFFCVEQYKEDKYWFYFSIWDPIYPVIVLNHENEKYDFFKMNELPDNLWRLFQKKINLLMDYLTQ